MVPPPTIEVGIIAWLGLSGVTVAAVTSVSCPEDSISQHSVLWLCHGVP